MERLLIMSVLFITQFTFSQMLPKEVAQAFKIQFPNTEIEFYKDNNTYNDFDGDTLYPDDEAGINVVHLDTVPEEAKAEHLRDPQDPTQYYIHFTKDKINMVATFKPDGTFVIATGRIDALPKKVKNGIASAFAGKKIRYGNDIVKAIVPNSYPPIYRVYVYVRKEGKHIVKVNEDGKIIMNTYRN